MQLKGILGLCLVKISLTRDYSGLQGSAKNNSSEIKYDICGWVILAVGIFTWIGMAKSQMPPPPAR